MPPVYFVKDHTGLYRSVTFPSRGDGVGQGLHHNQIGEPLGSIRTCSHAHSNCCKDLALGYASLRERRKEPNRPRGSCLKPAIGTQKSVSKSSGAVVSGSLTYRFNSGSLP